jgi:hypothetical protein
VTALTLLAGAISSNRSANAGRPQSPGRDNHVTSATISGGRLDTQIAVSIQLTGGMSVAYGETRSTLAPESSDLLQRTERPMTYAITLHYDLMEFGQGKFDREGSFDGVSVLHFPEPMIMGNGVWAAGWYRASAELAAQLQAALAEGISPPATGDGGLVP